MMGTLQCVDLGRIDYRSAIELQLRLVDEVREDPSKAYLLLLEHDPPVITLGRSAKEGNVLAPPQTLAQAGIEVIKSTRGGDVTYHGPGQLVGYLMHSLAARRQTVRGHMHDLEEAVIRTAAAFGIEACRIEKLTGVWASSGKDARKLAALGVAVKKWVTYHGLALNVSTDLSHFDLIVPCGLAGRKATSMRELLGRDVPMQEVKHALMRELAAVFGYEGNWLPSLFDGCMSPSSRAQGQGTRHEGKMPSGLAGGTPASLAGKMPTPRAAGTAASRARRLPRWLIKRVPPVREAAHVRQLLSDLHLSTVCAGAKCPNLPECFARGTATFLILGDACSRSCGYCAIRHGKAGPPREDEPDAVAQAAQAMRLRHVVVTSVTRDDLPDFGAGYFARTIEAIRRRLPRAIIEVLTPDFQGSTATLETVLAAGPDIFNHNIETVQQIYATVRPQADYGRSLALLAAAKQWAVRHGRRLFTKSGIMVGLGESDQQVQDAMHDLRTSGCDIVTIGQYLQPSPAHLPVARFVTPEQFERWRADALAMGFAAAACGPFVRSSYQAQEIFAGIHPQL